MATTSKNMYVKNAKARYTIYTENDEMFLYATMFTIIIHQMYYNSNEEEIKLGSQRYSAHTIQKELIDKYKPDFISNIISKEEPANLPENMQLVAEKVKQSQSTAILNYRRISSIIFVILFIGLIIFMMLK